MSLYALHCKPEHIPITHCLPRLVLAVQGTAHRQGLCAGGGHCIGLALTRLPTTVSGLTPVTLRHGAFSPHLHLDLVVEYRTYCSLRSYRLQVSAKLFNPFNLIYNSNLTVVPSLVHAWSQAGVQLWHYALLARLTVLKLAARYAAHGPRARAGAGGGAPGRVRYHSGEVFARPQHLRSRYGT